MEKRPEALISLIADIMFQLARVDFRGFLAHSDGHEHVGEQQVPVVGILRDLTALFRQADDAFKVWLTVGLE